MRIRYNNKISFRVRYPFLCWFLWSSSEIRIEEIGWMFLEANILINAGSIG